MCVALIGGMDRLEREYINEAMRYSVQLKVFTKGKTGLSARLHHMDAILLFTGKTSHRLKNEALGTAKSKNIPVVMSHSCGVCSLRECLNRLVSQRGAKGSAISGGWTAPVPV